MRDSSLVMLDEENHELQESRDLEIGKGCNSTDTRDDNDIATI